MYPIEMHTPTKEFSLCWKAAALHLLSCSQETELWWLKAVLIPPFLEHLSFRIGNQLFYIRIDDVDDKLDVPGNPHGVHVIAEGCNGHACIMPMRYSSGTWRPATPGWGLVDAKTGRSLDPFDLVTNEKIEMTAWELQDLAVQIVRDHVVSELGCALMSSQSNPLVDPSLWFVGAEGPEWVIVRAVRHTDTRAGLPPDIHEMARSLARLSKTGHFASVTVANCDTSDGASDELWRGYPLWVDFQGLNPI